MENRPKTVVLDGHTMNPGDLSWEELESVSELTVYPRTIAKQVIERSLDAEILLINKIVLGEQEFAALPKLKCVCITATGYDNVSLDAAKKHGVFVSNVTGYSTESVAQHVFALILALTNRVEAHNRSVQSGGWTASGDFSYTLQAIPELRGKTLGIVGFGRIGQRVAEIGLAFGMHILANRRSDVRAESGPIKFTGLDDLLERSDVVSLHTPLTRETKDLINADRLQKMKAGACLINTGRGGLIVEKDLREALMNGKLAAAALDVLSKEPPPADHPLLQLDNCILTPHLAWAGVASRKRLLHETVENVKAYIAGKPKNLLPK